MCGAGLCALGGMHPPDVLLQHAVHHVLISNAAADEALAACFAAQGYARLAASCWQQRAADRPTFEQLVLLLEQMKSETQSLQMEANAACGSYMGYFSS